MSGDGGSDGVRFSAAQVLEAEAERTRAMLANDFDALELILSDDLTYCHSSGRLDTKASFIGALRDGGRYLAVDRHNAAARMFGDVAVLTSSSDISLRPAPEADCIEIRAHVTQTWVNRGGRWLLVAHQATRRPPE